MEVEALNRQDSLRKSFYIPCLDRATARAIVKAFNTHVVTITDQLSQDVQLTSLDGLEFIYMVNILSRVDHNLDQLLDQQVLSTPYRLAKIILVKFKTPFSYNIKGASSSDVEDVSQIFIQLLLANYFQIILNFITGGYSTCWRDLQDIPEVEDRIIEESKDIMLKFGALQIIKGYFDTLGSIAAIEPLTGSQEEFQLLLLSNLRCMLYDFPPAQDKLLETSIIELLLNCIGWPALITETNTEMNAAVFPKIRDEFRLQLSCLQCLREAVNRHFVNTQRFSALGGWEKMVDFVLWVTEVFSINPILSRDRLMEGHRSIYRHKLQEPSRAWSSIRGGTVSIKKTATSTGKNILNRISLMQRLTLFFIQM
jgi:hypothetical protein